MILGNPDQFAVIIHTVKEWNNDDTFCNGVLFFCVSGDIYPKEIQSATLKSEIGPLQESMRNISIDEAVFSMEKGEAYKIMYEMTFTDDDEIWSRHHFMMTPYSLSDHNYYAFAVSNGNRVRILVSELKYIIEESTHELENLYISEAVITQEELDDIISNLRVD